MKPILVMTSCEKREDAEFVARKILKLKLAACVQISAPVKSEYWWKGEIIQEEEFVITMKSMIERFDLLSEKIIEFHPYDVPEIIATEIIAVSKPYLTWLVSEMSKKK